MSAMGSVSVSGYSGGMPKARSSRPPRKKAARSRAPRPRPNRIRELNKARGLTNEIVGEKVGAHPVTISRLATGKIDLTQEWMERLAPVYDVTPGEIAWKPAQAGLRRVRVKGSLQAGEWAETNEWEEDRQRDVMIPDDPELRPVSLYAGEVAGDSMNRIYPAGTVVVLSPVGGTGPDQVREGARYHVRHTRRDGQVEDTIKTLVRGEGGHWWLKPESTHPEHQSWIPLDGVEGETIELIGRVRYAVKREV